MKNKAMEKLFRLAYTDAMTGLHNRNAYEECLEKLRSDRSVLDNITVVVIDINDLKRINKTYGHHTGDEAIKVVATMLKRTIGEKAQIYRIDGDDFICISDKDIRPQISQFIDFMKFENRDRYNKINVAVGSGRFDGRKHDTIDDLLKFCDTKLIKDKQRKSR